MQVVYLEVALPLACLALRKHLEWAALQHGLLQEHRLGVGLEA